MPICKRCHHSISSFDKDLCPYCGEENPIDEGYETKDMTQFINPVTGDYKLMKSKSRRVCALLCLFLGSFGAHSFYLGFKRRGLIELIATIILISAIGSIFAFAIKLPISPALSYLIAFAIVFLFYAAFSIKYFVKDSLKDAHGEFLR